MPNTAPQPSFPSILPPPSPVPGGGKVHVVKDIDTMLRVRSKPIQTVPPNRNVVAKLPSGHHVSVLSAAPQNGFHRISTSLQGALIDGWAAAEYLAPADPTAAVPVAAPAQKPPAGRPPAVRLPAAGGSGAARAKAANALSLGEANAPKRSAGPAQQMINQLNAIIEWLNCESAAHGRYWPSAGRTFCNVYAHDYCTLAGAYLPRVWWDDKALMEIAKGKKPPAIYGKTLYEMRANDLFRWLTSWGLDFGWRRTGTLTKLQNIANAGGIGVIVARRIVEGKPGHISVVVPETGPHKAIRRNGEVVLPLQSQAGSKNVKRGTIGAGWWHGSQFADHGFWVHG